MIVICSPSMRHSRRHLNLLASIVTFIERSLGNVRYARPERVRAFYQRANALRASRNPLHRFEEARFVLEVDARRQHPHCPILNGDLGMSRFRAAYNNLTRYGPVSKIAKGYKRRFSR